MYATAYIWAKVLSYLEQQLSEITVSAWLDDAELVELKDDQLIIYSPSEFRQEIIREKCASYIEEALQEIFQIKTRLVVWGDGELHQYKEDKKKDPIHFNPQFTFDSYVTGESNQIAVKIAQAAANNPGNEVYNPLFIYGPPGVGKTHLQYAIANQIQATFPDKKIIYIKGDQFTNELVTAIRNGKTEAFKQKYRHEPDVTRTIEDICSAETKMPITATLIIRNVSRYFGVDEDLLKGPQKSRGIAEPRQIAMYLMKKLMNISFSDIGKEFGGRDHGTVHHSVKKIEAVLKLKDNPLDGVIQDITSNIENTIN